MDYLKVYEEIFEELERFYDRIENGEIPGLVYRNDQRTLSYNVFDSIQNQSVLIQEAGVGTGKTMGYLVPLVLTYSKFKEHGMPLPGFIVSTASIALQEQLKAELERVEKLLGVKAPVVIAKGKNNYVCLANAYSYLRSTSDTRFKKIISERIGGPNPETRKDMPMENFDKSSYSDITPLAWSQINVSNLNCRYCNFRDKCPYQMQRQSWADSRNIIITNHDMEIDSQRKTIQIFMDKYQGKKVTEDRGPLHKPSFLVIDEAHTFEEKVINAYSKQFTSPQVAADFNQFHDFFNDYNISRLIQQANIVFSDIRSSTNATIKKKKEESVTDEGRYPYAVTRKTIEDVQTFFTLFQEFSGFLDNLRINIGESPLSKDQYFALQRLIEFKSTILDMISPFEKRKNIYWSSFSPEDKRKVVLCCVDKRIPRLAAKIFKEEGYGKLFTSATLSTGKNEDGEPDFSYFMESIGLSPTEFQGTSITIEEPIDSPYDYDNNALMYISKNALSPRHTDHEEYLESIAAEIDKLMRASHGRSLVLFTSKSDMNAVYSRLKGNDYGFNLILQNENNSDISKQKFIEDTDSCLFSTGFWEGIDVKGEALQQVIIPKLPFPVVDPVIDSKAKVYGGGIGFEKVYMPSMLLDLKQGAGRLIRGENDIGVVSLLDARIIPNEYKDSIESSLPFTNITTNPEDVETFFKEKQKRV